MTDERISRLIHEKIMGKCWHDYTWRGGLETMYPYQCSKCLDKSPHDYGGIGYPSYTTDLNAVALAEAKVIEADARYYLAIRAVVGDDAHAWQWVCATARQRAEACLRAMGLWEGE